MIGQPTAEDFPTLFHSGKPISRHDVKVGDFLQLRSTTSNYVVYVADIAVHDFGPKCYLIFDDLSHGWYYLDLYQLLLINDDDEVPL